MSSCVEDPILLLYWSLYEYIIKPGKIPLDANIQVIRNNYTIFHKFVTSANLHFYTVLDYYAWNSFLSTLKQPKTRNLSEAFFYEHFDNPYVQMTVLSKTDYYLDLAHFTQFHITTSGI